MTKRYFIIWCFAVLFLAGLLFYGVFYNKQGEKLFINGKVVNLEIVDTPAKQEQGLSGRKSLEANQGMLFVFPEASFWKFWMKDMNFPIDMIWLDEDYKIVFIKENAEPKSYPEMFVSNSPAKYVLEVASGFAQENGLKEGSELNIAN